MFKKEFIRNVWKKLRIDEKKKYMKVPKHVLHISDDHGNKKDFVVRGRESHYVYTKDDVANILEAMSDVILEAIKHGDPVIIPGVCKIGVRYSKPRESYNVAAGCKTTMGGYYVPKITAEKELMLNARLYTELLKDKAGEIEPYLDESDY